MNFLNDQQKQVLLSSTDIINEISLLSEELDTIKNKNNISSNINMNSNDIIIALNQLIVVRDSIFKVLKQ